MTDRHVMDAPAEVRKPRFPLVPFDQVVLGTERRYLVKGLIPREGLTVVWGPPKCGKSFWTFDAVMHVALGWQYRGRRVQQGAVVYVACEGGDGFRARIEAWRRRFLAEEADPVPFYLLPARLSLIEDHAELIASIRVQMGGTCPAAVVIDTLNRSLVGSESRDEDMAAFIAAADAIREAFGGSVIVVHHCGVEGTRPRGHTSLTGAADAQIAVKKNGDTFTATVEFMKDGPDGEEVTCALELVELDTDDDGDPITSLVVVEADATGITNAVRLNPRQRNALDVLHNCLADAGQPSPGGTHYPPSLQVVPLETWKEYLFNAGVLDREAKNPRQDFRRLFLTLQDKGKVREWNRLVWLVADEPV